jgi:hypothetical protein
MAEALSTSARIVSTSSPVGTAVYNATKSAVGGLTRTFAKELGQRRIRVNSINPGPIETEGTHATGFIDRFHPLAAVIPLGRIGQPKDVAPGVVFLAFGPIGHISPIRPCARLGGPAGNPTCQPPTANYLEGLSHHLLTFLPKRGGVGGIERISTYAFANDADDGVVRYDPPDVAVLAVLTADSVSGRDNAGPD